MKKTKRVLLAILLILLMLWYITQDHSTVKQHDKFVPAHSEKTLRSDITEPKNQVEETLSDIKAAREALEDWRLAQEMAIQHEREKLTQEWKKLEEEQNRLEDEKEAIAAGIQLGVYKRKQAEAGDQEKKEKDERKKFLDSLAPANASHFEGLNSTEIHKNFPEITFLPEYKVTQFVEADKNQFFQMPKPPRSIHDLDDIQAEERFYELVTKLHVDCLDIVRQGSHGDGGYDTCMSAPYTARSPCVVYSFGINNDFTFDDAMANRYRCDVRSFDPSMTLGDHKHSNLVWFYQLGLGARNTVNALGWKLETLGSILAKSDHAQSVIDVLKIDIDYNEWDCLLTIFKEGILHRVKQLLLEIHTPEMYLINRPSTREDFYSMYNRLLELEQQGFRRFGVGYNPHGAYLSQRSGKHRTCCYELSYININFLKS